MHWNSILLLFPRVPFFCFINYSLFQGSVIIRTIISRRLKPYIYKYSNVRAGVSQTVDWTQIRTAPQIHAARLIQISSEDFNDSLYITEHDHCGNSYCGPKQSKSCLASLYMTGRETAGFDSRLDWRTIKTTKQGKIGWQQVDYWSDREDTKAMELEFGNIGCFCLSL